jgi:hypothetical protein
VLIATVLLLGPLLSVVPLQPLQLATGLLLLLFGMRWLRKRILRAAGIIPLHDETMAFAAETAEMLAAGPIATLRLDPVAVVTTFKAVVLEGIEVSFIAIAVGAAGHTCWLRASVRRSPVCWCLGWGSSCTGRWRGCRRMPSSLRSACSFPLSAASGSGRGWALPGRARISPSWR